MEAQEKKAQDILRHHLGHIYKGQSYEELEPFRYFGGFYMKICNEQKIELKSDVITVMTHYRFVICRLTDQRRETEQIIYSH